ncbi:hypothetical protein D3C87_370740 [compost metagenome]
MDSSLLSISQQFSGLPMDALIGGPLNAAADANAKMAVTQTKFLLDTCFEQIVSGTPPNATYKYKPIMIVMELSRPVIDTNKPDPSGPLPVATVQFNLPLLTIVPLNSLAVDSVNITFDMEVKSSFAQESSKESVEKLQTGGSFEAKVGWGPFSVTVKGSASYDSSNTNKESQHYQKSNSAQYHVDVHAGQLPLPMGVTTIINAFSNSIQPIELKAPAVPANP